MNDHVTIPAVKIPQVTVVGVYVKSDAYPNVKYKVEGILNAKSLNADEINFLPENIEQLGKFRSGISGAIRSIGNVLNFGYAHLRVIFAIISLPPRRTLYVPYPSVFVLYLISFLPKHWKPGKVCADVFISLYDTIVADRKLVSQASLLARLLRAIEKRAYQSADLILVDTELNALHLCETFKLGADKVKALPLCINEEVYRSLPYVPIPGRCNVLFIGTFVPLQGVEIIAQAIVMLKEYKHIHFHLVGDGQTSGAVADILASAGNANVTWERHWQNATVLAEAIGNSDICLGIFGVNEKTRRVWPLKNYAYMAIGRAIITADTPAARELFFTENGVPFMTVPAGQPQGLAQAIIELANDPERRIQYAVKSRLYYEQYLSNSVSLNRLIEQLV